MKNKSSLRIPFEKIYFRNGLFLISVSLLVCFVGVIFYRLITSDYKISLPDIILIGLLIFFLSGLFDNLSEFSWGEKGFVFRLHKVEKDVKVINEIIARHVLTNGEYLQLCQLNRKEESVYVEYCFFLKEEMMRLCQHEFAQENNKNDLWRMKDAYENTPNAKFNLKEYFHITPQGKVYLKIIEELKKGSDICLP